MGAHVPRIVANLRRPADLIQLTVCTKIGKKSLLGQESEVLAQRPAQSSDLICIKGPNCAPFDGGQCAFIQKSILKPCGDLSLS